MAFTLQQLVDRARLPLQDAAKTRYADDTLLGYANSAIQQLILKRPDLFFGSFTALPGQLTLVQNFPLDDMYMQAVADYVTARARAKSAEEVTRAQAQAYFDLFTFEAMK